MNGYPENHIYSIITGPSVKQFDDIYKEIESKYEKYEIKRLSSRRNRERDIGVVADVSSLISRIRLPWFWCIQALHYLHLDGIPIWFGLE